MNPISYENGTEVYNQSNEKVGTIDRIVIDPQTNEVTHIVVRKGFFFTEDKVIPVPFLEHTDDGKPRLRKEVSDVDALPDFEDAHYVLADAEDLPEGAGIYPNSMYWYPRLSTAMTLAYPPFYNDVPPRRVTVTERNIPEGHVALKKNAHVYGKDGERIGTIGQIFSHPDTNEVTYFLVQKGFLLKEDKLVPAWWVEVTEEDEVRLAVNSAIFDRLPEFVPES